MSDPTLPLAPGTRFAGCEIEQVVGRGGMGVVYRARDLALDRPVAIKLVASARAGDEQARHRFEREARLMAAIDHPNVIPVYAAGEEDGHLYLVMRLVTGTDLQRLLTERGRLAPIEAARIVDQVGRALDAAHDRGLVHRDIKPANVLLSGDHVYLTDFGITRLVDEGTGATGTGEWVGTVDYMSPEHLRGEPTDARSDVYSLGCLLYACLAGRPPFHRETAAATITAQLHDDPPSVAGIAGVSRRFDDVLARALAKRPRDRYRSAGRLGTAALAAAQSGSAVDRVSRVRRRSARVDPVAFGAALDPGDEPTRVLSSEAVTSIASRGAGLRRVSRAALTGRAARTGRAALQGRARVPGVHRRPWRRVLVACAVAAVIAGIVIGALATGRTGPRPPGPIDASELTDVVQQFATDYGNADSRGLAQLLAPGITRIDQRSIQHGQLAVLAEYEQQFHQGPQPIGYTLTGLHVIGGWAGRVSGRYTVTVKGGAQLSGTVTFGLERVHGGAVEIALIVTQLE